MARHEQLFEVEAIVGNTKAIYALPKGRIDAVVPENKTTP
jgi:hypothetical protein